MAVILEERGRGKFKPAPDYEVDEVKDILNQKIEEERREFKNCSVDIEFDKLKYDKDKFNVLSLFSGCGGLDLGFEIAGLKAVMGEYIAESAMRDKKVFDKNINNNVFNIIYANDIFDEARETYEKNAGRYIYMDKSDIRKIKEFPRADIVLGGFPCPGFSEAGPRLVDDKRNFLYLHFIRCLMQSNPKIFVAENVKGMMTLGKGEVFKQIVQDFSAAGYKVYHKLLNAAEYGVPQIRERVFLVGVRDDIDFVYKHPEPTHGYGVEGLEKVVTLKDAIGDLESDPGDYFTGTYSTIFMSRNRKKNWSDPSFTIQASGRQAPIHPAGTPMVHIGKDKYAFSEGEENNRRLSVKEIARIQTFPDWYEFSRGQNSKKNENAKLDLVYKQIGNAVPVRLAMAIAEPIAEWIREENSIRIKRKKRGDQALYPRTGKRFSKAEKRILDLMVSGTKFKWMGETYTVSFSDKPTCPKGGPKTDVYILAKSNDRELEIKISYKKENADFIENKINADRACQILGSNWKEIIEQKIYDIEDEIMKRALIYFDKFGNIDSGSIALGWRFEIVDKLKAGKLSGDLGLTTEQLIEAYKGERLEKSKRDALVCGRIISNSGVAEYILRKDVLNSVQDIIDNLVKIEDYVKEHPTASYVCKALNYRTKYMKGKKWDGNRPLSISVKWSDIEGRLTPIVVLDKPLQVYGNEMAQRLEKYMEIMHIRTTDDLNVHNLGTDKVYRKI